MIEYGKGLQQTYNMGKNAYLIAPANNNKYVVSLIPVAEPQIGGASETHISDVLTVLL